mmetsp:Transcript_11436/g.20177  ORF Transcript_11436/g.20177 Transcript_11436/m.20177 type:complete len:227 (-) Transcript_11436:869-1549(-)
MEDGSLDELLAASQLTTVDGIHDGPGVRKAHALAHAIAATGPAGVDEPRSCAMLGHLLCQHTSILHGVPHQEGGAKAGRESGLRLLDALLCASNLGGVARDEVVHGLLVSQLADRWEHAKGITAQKDDILGLRADARNARVVDVVDGVASARIFCNVQAVIVHHASAAVELDIFQHCAKLDSVPDLWLLGGLQVDGLCIAATLNVEHTMISPAVLIITNQRPLGVS